LRLEPHGEWDPADEYWGEDDVAPEWARDNRPFLRCLHGQGLCLWRLGQTHAALAVFERMLWLNPSDNQGVRLLIDDVRSGGSWEELEDREESANRSSRRRATAPREPSKREISVDLAEIAFAIEDSDPDHTWYLDRETGVVHLVAENSSDDDLPVPREDIEGDERFVPIESEGTDRAYRDMEEFTATVKDREFRSRLSDSLAGKGAFSRFRQTLAGNRVERERWFAFRQARLDARARAWLASIDVKLQGR
jgi:hypothetical protein